MKKSGVAKKILFAFEIIILLILIGGLFVYGKINSSLDKLNTTEIDENSVGINEDIVQSERLQGYTNIAIFGIDSRGEGSELSAENSDVIIIASINNDTKEVKLVSLYRDTLLDVGNDSYEKCNAAYAYGGAQQALTMLNTNLDLNIQDYVTVNFAAVTEVVDCLGGVDIEMTRDEVIHMNNYCEGTAAVTGKSYEPIEVPAEDITQTYHLDGTQATSYARIRYGGGDDYKRTERQRTVITKLVEKAKKASLSQLTEIMDQVFPLIETSFQKNEIFEMGASMLSYNLGESMGFPKGFVPVTFETKGSCVVPVTLRNNVVELHNFLFGTDTGYEPSETVLHRSEVIVSLSGYDETYFANSTDSADSTETDSSGTYSTEY